MSVSLHTYMYIMCVCLTHTEARRRIAGETLELVLYMVMNYNVGTGN